MSLLDDLDGSIEEEKELDTKKDEALQGMVDKIVEEYAKFPPRFDNKIMSRYEQWVKNKLDFSITPRAIESFLQKYNEHEYAIKAFITMLVQNAYVQGHNDFVLPVLKAEKGWIISDTYSYLTGKKDDLINITMND